MKHTLIDFLGRNYKREDVAKRDTTTVSGNQKMAFINDSGLYSPSLYDQQAEVVNSDLV